MVYFLNCVVGLSLLKLLCVYLKDARAALGGEKTVDRQGDQLLRRPAGIGVVLASQLITKLWNAVDSARVGPGKPKACVLACCQYAVNSMAVGHAHRKPEEVRRILGYRVPGRNGTGKIRDPKTDMFPACAAQGLQLVLDSGEQTGLKGAESAHGEIRIIDGFSQAKKGQSLGDPEKFRPEQEHQGDCRDELFE